MNISKKITLCAAGLISALLFYYEYSLAQKDIKKITANVMNYHMDNIIERCKEDYKYTNEDMAIIEKEFKKFMILSIISETNSESMFSQDVDNLWHTFLLFTKEYADFCKKHAGRFIHHVPQPHMSRTPEKAEIIAQYFVSFAQNYEKVFGEEIHHLWLLDMSEAAGQNIEIV